jgi:hypothetical protein
MAPNDRPAAPTAAAPTALPAAAPTAPMAAAPTAPPAADDGSAHPSGPSRRAPREVHRPLHVDPKPPAAALTREQLGQKFQQVRREYDQFKAKFGSRLEREWGELATYITFTANTENGGDAVLRAAASKLEVFRARMHE